MLALLVDRTIERRLRNAGAAMTVPAVFEDLASVHLNMIGLGHDKTISYVPTEPNTSQREPLPRHQLERVVDQDHLASSITPRPVQ